MIVRLCTEIRQKNAVLLILQLVFDFEHGGGDHLGKWRQSVGDTFFVLSMLLLVCVPNFIKIGS